jgi:multidrug efflux pump
MFISNTALRNRTSVLVLTVLITIVGIVSFALLPRESFPQIKVPNVMVITPYPGVSPEDVESLVTTPIEKKLKEIADVKKISSSSSEGLSFINVEFEPEVELDAAIQKVRDKVDLAKPDIPSDAEDSQIEEINFDNIPVMIVNLYADYGLLKLKDVAEDLQDKLEDINGVLEVDLIGGLEKEVQVEVDPRKLEYYAVGVNDVINAIREENLTIPGGTMEIGDLKYLVRIPGEYDIPANMADIMLKDDGSQIYLRDVATIKFTTKEQESISRVNKLSSVSLNVVKRSGENIIGIADEVREILAAQEPLLPRGTEIIILGDMSKDIRSQVNELQNNIIAGLILVVFVLYFFLGFRNGLLVGLAIPFSMFLTFIIITFMDTTLNFMVLFSLILALGMLVDNAIVVIENIYRHREEGYSLIEAAKVGTSEVALPIITSTITTLVAFSPLLFWSGIIGEFMKLLPMTLIITLASSLFVGLVINPVLASRFVKVEKKKLKGEDFFNWLIQRYDVTLNWAISHPVLTLLFAVGSFFFVFIMWAGPFNTGVEFFPETEPRQILVDVDTKGGTRIEETDRILKKLEQKVGGYSDVKASVVNVGVDVSQMFGGGGSPSHLGRLTIELEDKVDRAQSSWETMKEVRESVRDITGATIKVDKPDDGPPTGAEVQIEVSGEDFIQLGQISRLIRDEISDIEGLVDLQDDFSEGNPEIRINIDREKARLFGINTRDLAQTIRTAVNGTEASKYRVGEDDYDIVVRYPEEQRKFIGQIRDIPLFHKGQTIPLINVADISFTGGLGTVRHIDLDKVVTITAAAAEGYQANAILGKVKERLSDYNLPPGVKIKYTGQDEEQIKSFLFLLRAFAIAFFLVFFVLVTQFDSLTLPLIIMTSVVLSLMGVFTGLIVMMLPFGIIMTGIGVISLAGVVVNNAIVLIDYINILRERGHELKEAIIAGGRTRLRPVILTAITTILGLVPLTLGINIDFIGFFTGDWHNLIEFGAESSQFWRSMGWAVIFGLSFATGLTLVVVPTLYWLIARWSDRYKKKAEDKTEHDPNGQATYSV